MVQEMKYIEINMLVHITYYYYRMIPIWYTGIVKFWMLKFFNK